MPGQCPRCRSEVALHAGRPVVEGGVVELWHPSCWEVRHARGVEAVAIVAPRPALSPRALAIGGAALLALGLGGLAVASRAPARPGAPAAAAANGVAPDDEPLSFVQHAAREELPAAPDVATRYPVPIVDGLPLDDQFPSLREWAHPVSDSAELVPEMPSRRFGADRAGVERTECGAGHCGVDLDGPRGRPIVAVADGVVVRVERHEMGLDGRSGRYVRIEHDDGTLTAYMHLDDIADGLEVGDHVEAGDMIGTLGATAVYSAPPHLHFSLEVPLHAGRHGDHSDTRYVDPAPYLARATVISAPDRRRAKPTI